MAEGPPGEGPASPPVTARSLAAGVLERIERDGAYANIALRHALDRCSLDTRDRALVTELVYGVTRLRRRCDHAVDRFVVRDPDPSTRTLLRLGAHQLLHLDHVPAHAAVSETVALAPRRSRPFVNAVLRRVAAAGPLDDDWPSPAVRWSVPDHLWSRLAEDLGAEVAADALAEMNRAGRVTVRDDGYVQDRASQMVAETVEARRGDVVVDVCAAPGGKATLLATTGATVVAGDLNPARARLCRAAASTTATRLAGVVVADGLHPPWRLGSADAVLVDAPCSGLGVLHRRPDARWRIGADDPERLADLQVALVEAAASLVRPGGRLVYSVCTLTRAETVGVDGRLAKVLGDEWEASAPPTRPWRTLGRGGLLLPQDEGTDGMFVLRLARRAEPGTGTPPPLRSAR